MVFDIFWYIDVKLRQDDGILLSDGFTDFFEVVFGFYVTNFFFYSMDFLFNLL